MYDTRVLVSVVTLARQGMHQVVGRVTTYASVWGVTPYILGMVFCGGKWGDPYLARRW